MIAQFPAEQAKSGEFKRQEDTFRDWVRRDGSTPYLPARDRYHLTARQAGIMARKAGVRAPFTESLFGLIRARAQSTGQYR